MEKWFWKIIALLVVLSLAFTAGSLMRYPSLLPLPIQSLLRGEPIPGKCLILESRYCKLGKMIPNPLGTDNLIVYKLPPEVRIFSPVDGHFSNSPVIYIDNKPYRVATISVSTDRSVKTISARYSFLFIDENMKNPVSLGGAVKKGGLIGKTSKEVIEPLGDYNLIVSMTRYTHDENKLQAIGTTEELARILQIQ